MTASTKGIAHKLLGPSSSQRSRLSFMPLRATRSDGAIRPAAKAKSPSHLPSACVRPAGFPAGPFPTVVDSVPMIVGHVIPKQAQKVTLFKAMI